MSKLVRPLTLLAIPALLAGSTAWCSAPAAPESAFPAAGNTTFSDATATSATSPLHTLLGIRLRPMPDSLRVILTFDSPTPLTVREDLPGQRIYIDLINAKIEYLAPELSKINDERLNGIWLGRMAGDLSSLELRLPSSAIRIDRFTLKDPPVLVIDLTRTDLKRVNLAMPGTVQEFSAELPSPADASQTASARPAGPVLPPAWLDGPATSSTKKTAAPPAVRPSATPEPVLPPPVVLSQTAPGSETLTITKQAAAAPDPVREINPINAEFDGFPVHALTPASEEGRRIRQDFLYRRWAGVIDAGVAFLKDRPIDQEAIQVLYMMAEARWQLGSRQAVPPLPDMINFYQQALRRADNGDLAAYGRFRLAQARLEQTDYPTAIADADHARKSGDPGLRVRAAMLRARLMGKNGQSGPALAEIEKLKSLALPRDRAVELAVLEGTLRLEADDASGAWSAFNRAGELDPGWINLDPEGVETMARAAAGVGRYDAARRYIEFINHNFSSRDDTHKVRLMLFYAEVLDKLGDGKTAESTYAILLDRLSNTPKGQAVQEEMLRRHPESVVESESRYSLLLLRKGKIREAMAELDRSSRQAMREGIDTTPLVPVMERILPAFMEQVARAQQPFEAVQAWQLYGYRLQDPAVRARCMPSLAEALDETGLPREALEIIRQVRRDLPTTETLPARLRLREAVLNQQLGDPERAIALLEELIGDQHDPLLQAEILKTLAEAYEKSRRPVEAAQAWQALADTPGIDLPLTGTAWSRAGEIFLEQGMPLQTIELALKGLLQEKQHWKEAAQAPWSPQTSQALRMMLAQAYLERADQERALLVLRDYADRRELLPAQLAEARFMISQCQTRLGDAGAAQGTLAEMLGDAQTPPLWRNAARQAQETFAWNTKNPQWSIPTVDE